MRSEDFVRDIRFFLGDLPERSSTSSLFWQTDEILATAETCRDTLIKALWSQQRSRQQPFQLAVTNCLKSLAIGANALPDDYWRGVCAVSAAGEYLPFESTERSSGLLAVGDRLVSVSVAGFKLPTDVTTGLIYYVALPTDTLGDAGSFPNTFTDSFYECLALLTCLTLLGKKERASADQMMYLAKEVSKVVPTLL
jgi:hypothetical protein